MIVAIDGPAASGKSTTARQVARRLGFLYLDTGAMYRAVALGFLEAGHSPTPEGARKVLPDLSVDVRHKGEAMHVYLNGTDVTERLRSQEVGTMASRVSKLPEVREKMVEEQRRIARRVEDRGGGVVLEGRDIGTVVFPEADVKIFLVAALEERARRRQAELAARGTEAALEEVKEEIKERDRADRERAVAPLRRADDAVEVDTTQRTVEEQVQQVVECVRERQRQSSS